MSFYFKFTILGRVIPLGYDDGLFEVLISEQDLISPGQNQDQPKGTNDGRDAFLVMSSAYYDRTFLLISC